MRHGFVVMAVSGRTLRGADKERRTHITTTDTWRAYPINGIFARRLAEMVAIVIGKEHGFRNQISGKRIRLGVIDGHDHTFRSSAGGAKIRRGDQNNIILGRQSSLKDCLRLSGCADRFGSSQTAGGNPAQSGIGLNRDAIRAIR